MCRRVPRPDCSMRQGSEGSWRARVTVASVPLVSLHGPFPFGGRSAPVLLISGTGGPGMVTCAPNRSQGLCQEHLPPSSPHGNFGAGDPPPHPRMGTLLHPDLCPCRIWKLRCSRIGDPAVYGDFDALQMAQSPHMATSVQPGGASKLLYVARYLPSLHRGFYTWQVGP